MSGHALVNLYTALFRNDAYKLIIQDVKNYMLKYVPAQ